MLQTKFIHLKVHSDYSMIDGLATPEALVKHAYNSNMVALGLTDINNLYGVVKFYSAARTYGIKPIIGMDICITSHIIKNKIFHLTILTKNNIGYKNLINLISESYQKGYDENVGPIIKLKDIISFRKGLLILSGGMLGDIGSCLMKNDLNLLKKCIYFYKKYFLNKYYLEISRLDKEQEHEYIEKIKNISCFYSLPLVATNNVSFLRKKDFKIHKIRVAIHQKKNVSDPNFIYTYTKQQFLKNEQEMVEIFCDIPEALINSVEIAKRCNVIIPSGEYFLPVFSTQSIDMFDFFLKKVTVGLNNRLNENYPNIIEKKNYSKVYFKRLMYETKIIKKMGFISYFLIVMEFIQWAKDHNIPVGPGRGSGPGSLVAYSLYITELDPIKFDLLFERFLNPDRVSLPDFDIDFCMDKRDLVIEHVSNKYGRNSVAQIVTFGTMAAKAVIRDVGRVLGYPYGLINKISKLVPLDPGMTLEKAFLIQKDLINLYNVNNDIKKLIDIAKKLEGVTRNIGKHAGGVVIAPTKISDFVPVFCDAQGQNQITQFDKNDIEYIGLVKFDFLGLKTLTMIYSCIKKLINKKKLKIPEISINSLDLKDKNSFKLLKSAETISIFQLESAGMRNLIRRLQPDSFEDIIALVALFRPGPLQSGMVDNFIARKHGREIISYPDKKWQHELLKPILKPTYGIILYQEQVMKIAQVLAGYTPGEADLLRRAMGKKDPKEMKRQKKIFKIGSEKIGICPNLSEKIFALLEKFSAYGFNKSHSATYALISYQTLWLKANYPEEFMASAMTLDMDNTEKIILLIQDARRMNVKIIAPNINISNYSFSISKNKEIVYGLGAIKGLGKASIDHILKERNSKKVAYKNFLDFCIRIFSKCITRRILERLIMSGACDCFKICRFDLFNKIEYYMRSAKQYLESIKLKQNFLFDFNYNCFLTKSNQIQEIKIIKKEDVIEKKNNYFQWERETLGFYLTNHPIKNFIKELHYYTKKIKLSDCTWSSQKKNIIIAGMIFSIKIKFTKNNKKFYLITLDDSFSRLDIIFFSDIHDKKIHYLLNNKNILVVIIGDVYFDKFRGCSRFLVKKIIELKDFRINRIKKILLKINKNVLAQENYIIHSLEYYFNHYVNIGTVHVSFLISEKYRNKYKIFQNQWNIQPDDNFFNYINFLSQDIKVKIIFLK
ncbi:DNA polymerase III, alpha subunit [Buchnera aphidicola (Cinara tujafilina)]|uniref:DNA polymerase III subunit alpha n=1 Tax=Buchnera aphidicola (Cinara tujafilina) TaxID=261317 RepID=F7WZ86_9GAMM|nr:DNA polymerase III subunit alpha [Buchnera aphidicola]AEH39740.1 DNA polymerase III, alpha subunit [Buchnera aphidicola (Cinara tujafilina)]